MLRQALCIISKPSVNSNWSYSPETPNSGQNRHFLSRVTVKFAGWPWKNKTKQTKNPWRANLLCYFKLCASFRSNWWIKTGVTVRKRPIWVKIGDFFVRVTLKFDGWPWETIGHLFHATSSFMHHFVAICSCKVMVRKRPNSGQNRRFFCPVRPWNLTDDLEKQ